MLVRPNSNKLSSAPRLSSSLVRLRRHALRGARWRAAVQRVVAMRGRRTYSTE